VAETVCGLRCWNNNSHRRSCYTVRGLRYWNKNSAVTLSVVYDAKTTTHTIESYYTLHGLRCWNNNTKLLHWPQQLHLEPELTIIVAWPRAETFRTQIPLLNSPWFTMLKQHIKAITRGQIKKLLLQLKQQHSTQHLFTIVVTVCCGRLGYPIPV